MEPINYLWKDRKRYFGLPISFTRYRLSENRIFRETGLFNLKEEEADVSISLEEIAGALPVKIGEKLLEQTGSQAKQGEIPLRELWTKETEYCAGGAVYSLVEGHGAKLFAL